MEAKKHQTAIIGVIVTVRGEGSIRRQKFSDLILLRDLDLLFLVFL